MYRIPPVRVLISDQDVFRGDGLTWVLSLGVKDKSRKTGGGIDAERGRKYAIIFKEMKFQAS
jgi:hypothetical protein